MKLISSVLLVLLVVSQNLMAAGNGVNIIDPYVRSVPPGQTVSAAFLQLKNTTSEVRTVINATSPVSKVVELHSHVHEEGMMKMRRIDSIAIPANGMTVLKPGGLHIMLIGLHKPLKLDQKVSLTLEFKDGSSQTVEAPVRKIMMPGMMKDKDMMGKGMNPDMMH